MQFMLSSTDDIPLNFAFTGKGNAASHEGLEDQIVAGAVGLKLHEDWGTTPSSIDACISVCDKYDVQATIHTDTLNESGFVESSIAAFKGRAIHAYHTEGAGGGHAPDILRVVGEANVIPSSTNPTRAFTKNTLDEHVDMLMVCHHLSRSIPEDVAFAESRIRAETIQAEDILHDTGAISIISSDSQAMGRVGEVISRTWHTASKMKDQRGWLKGEGAVDSMDRNDNFRVKRYVAKYTINPAIVSGISHIIGSIEVGKFADLVMYKPSLFGTKPELVIKGGLVVYAQMGDANASIPTTQPLIARPMFGGLPLGAAKSSIAFVSKASVDQGVVTKYGLRKRVEPVKGCRTVRKTDMKLNSALPKMKVDPETYKVFADGELLQCAAANEVPMSQSVYLFQKIHFAAVNEHSSSHTSGRSLLGYSSRSDSIRIPIPYRARMFLEHRQSAPSNLEVSVNPSPNNRDLIIPLLGRDDLVLSHDFGKNPTSFCESKLLSLKVEKLGA